MTSGKFIRTMALLACAGAVAACENGSSPFERDVSAGPVSEAVLRQRANTPPAQNAGRTTVWDLFGAGQDPNVTVEVNKYIWNATQQILDFMPVEAVDPFAGVIVYGYGTPPGGSRAYRATVYVQDPALDARSLNVALATSSGPASPDTVRALEDAILTRARQLRLQDTRL
ncbi:DUF3576 domain-containing protein [Tranquillimonas alkanivorans]|uniref:DUF3576 domain-containing protein n=1 Tax=Tranquillimonas alkanivorans TaxID=441119 RepID=A0A1I5W8N5_9RHOB|nr:DUF3576 domain-containing protein [Tranquillimonas alkanivorans]SFQ15616.1 protein of unknown function [Tranquillimonas alkanivorans]